MKRFSVVAVAFGIGSMVLSVTTFPAPSFGANAQSTTTGVSKPGVSKSGVSKPGASKPGTSSASSASAATYVQLILDASGSMYAQLANGGTRIAAAKEVLATFISQLPQNPDLNVGLRIYGAVAKAGTKAACTDSKLVLPMKGIARQELANKVAATQPKGSTPIAYSLEQAALDFPTDISRKLVILVTDGIESCDGDLKKAVAAFKARGIEVDLRIVGIDLDERARKSFDGVGSFENTKTAGELAAAIGRAASGVAKPVTAKLPVMVTLTSAGKPVTTAAQVRFISVKGDASFFTALAGSYKTDLSPGVYRAEIESTESGLQNFSGLTVAVGAPNAFTFEIGSVTPVKLEVKPNPPTAGGKLTATFSGAPNKSPLDWVAISIKSMKDGEFYDSVYVKGASGSVELNVPDVDVPLELRYHVASPTGASRVIGRSATFTAKRTPVSLVGPTQAVAGSSVQVKWTGPNNQYDYVTVVKPSAPDGTFTNYQYTSQGNPVSILIPLDTGDYEFRYSNDTSRKTLARSPIKIVAASYGLDAPITIVAGAAVTVKWTGPNNKSDYITIVKKGAPVGTYLKYQYTSQGNPVTFSTPAEPGDYELRYSSEAQTPNPTLASRPITLTAATFGLVAPPTVKAGSNIPIRWTGPNNAGDYITIVKKGAPIGTYTVYFYTANGNPGTLLAPKEAGQYELRYSTEASSPNPTLFTLPIIVN
jgi:Ca-activated chloride channel homolog